MGYNLYQLSQLFEKLTDVRTSIRIPRTEQPGRLQSMDLKESDTTERLSHLCSSSHSSQFLGHYSANLKYLQNTEETVQFILEFCKSAHQRSSNPIIKVAEISDIIEEGKIGQVKNGFKISNQTWLCVSHHSFIFTLKVISENTVHLSSLPIFLKTRIKEVQQNVKCTIDMLGICVFTVKKFPIPSVKTDYQRLVNQQ